MDTAAEDDFCSRFEMVESRIADACERAGRDRSEVELVAVSKTFPPESVKFAEGCGQRVFGENRLQEAAWKIPQCNGGLEWHLIGHLQRNKVRVAVELFSVIHGVDSLKLLNHIIACCAEKRAASAYNGAGEYCR